MKSILYAGAALMAGAAIYGFVDFKKTNTNREFRTLYEEKETLQPALFPEKELTISPVEPAEGQKEMKEVNSVKEKEIRKGEVKQEPGKTGRVKESKTEKELNPELFSRAPLKKTPGITATKKLEK